MKTENKNSKKMRTIALEEHYATPAFMEASKHRLRDQAKKVSDRSRGATLIDRLCDVGDLRIEEMNAAGIDMQVLSLTSPGVQQMEAAEAVAIAHEQNDYLADSVKHCPDRFAALPTPVLHGLSLCVHGGSAQFFGPTPGEPCRQRANRPWQC
jgi:predicted TIM-barrel fold metal-dependent hydrolase